MIIKNVSTGPRAIISGFNKVEVGPGDDLDTSPIEWLTDDIAEAAVLETDWFETVDEKPKRGRPAKGDE